MKKIAILLLLSIIIMTGTLTIFPAQSYAAFPISNTQTEKFEKQETDIKLQKKNSIVQKKVSSTTVSGDDSGVYGILALLLGLVGWSIIAFGSGLGFLLLVGALITGVVGVNPKRKLKGMAVTGLILGVAGVVLFLLALLVIAAL